MYLVYRVLEGDLVFFLFYGKVIFFLKRKLKLSLFAFLLLFFKGFISFLVSSFVFFVIVSYKFVKCVRKLVEWYLNFYLRIFFYSG